MYLLLAEDNEALGKIIVDFLTIKWYQVHWVQDGEIAEEMIKKTYYDLILLDVMMPKIDGFEVLLHIREKRKTPIIMLTAKWELDDKKTGFTLWADDYLVKPFDLEELELRIQALLSRTQTHDVYHIDDVEVYVDENIVKKWWVPVLLTTIEFMILVIVVTAWGKTVQKADILEEIWWGEVLWEETGKLDVHIHNIRKKLGKNIILTVKWVGYRCPV